MTILLLIVGGWALYALGYNLGARRGYKMGMNDAGDMITQLQNAYDESEAKE